MQTLKYLCIGVLGFVIGFWVSPAYPSDENGEAFCLAQNLYFEAGNQPLAGKVAVAHVVLNRANSDRFPNTICDVVYQSKKYYTSWKGETVPSRGMCQFSWWCDGKSDEPKDSKTWIQCMQIAQRFLQNPTFDLTEGALWYHADYIKPYWSHHLNETVIINNHIFYR